jgi:hypothetical protein
MKHVIPANQICHLLLARLVDGAAVRSDIEGQPLLGGWQIGAIISVYSGTK